MGQREGLHLVKVDQSQLPNARAQQQVGRVAPNALSGAAH